MTFGARTAWRNSARCSGRSQWQSLMLRDCRNVTTIDQMFVQICQHIKESSNNGIIIPMISVFPPRKNGRDPIRIWNPQMISYAGYATDDPKVFIGDRANASFTQVIFVLIVFPRKFQTDQSALEFLFMFGFKLRI